MSLAFSSSSMEDPVYKALLDHGKAAVRNLPLYALLTDIDDLKYAELITHALAIQKKSAARVTISLPDGSVVFDSAKEGNKFDNFARGLISENHNTRVAIFKAQTSKHGVGYERKLSTTTGSVEKSVAVRIGPHLESAGTLRLSMKS